MVSTIYFQMVSDSSSGFLFSVYWKSWPIFCISLSLFHFLFFESYSGKWRVFKINDCLTLFKKKIRIFCKILFEFIDRVLTIRESLNVIYVFMYLCMIENINLIFFLLISKPKFQFYNFSVFKIFQVMSKFILKFCFA